MKPNCVVILLTQVDMQDKLLKILSWMDHIHNQAYEPNIPSLMKWTSRTRSRHYIKRRYKPYQLSIKTLTPWITLHTWILLPKALQVRNGFILLVSTHLEAPSHIYKGVTPATPWLKPWHVAPGTDLGKVTRKLHLKGESRWPHPLVGRPVGSADQWAQPLATAFV